MHCCVCPCCPLVGGPLPWLAVCPWGGEGPLSLLFLISWAPYGVQGVFICAFAKYDDPHFPGVNEFLWAHFVFPWPLSLFVLFWGGVRLSGVSGVLLAEGCILPFLLAIGCCSCTPCPFVLFPVWPSLWILV